MIKFLHFSLLVISLFINAQQNSLLSSNFWQSKPNLEKVVSETIKGNDPSELNDSSFDPVTMSIMNNADLDVIKFLISQEGNYIDKLTHDDRTYLHWAAMSGRKELIEYLIDKGSDVNKLDSRNFTPLTFAAYFGLNNVDIYNIFFKAGVNPKQKYANGANIMHLSIGNDKDGKLQKLFTSKGLSIKNKDKNGHTTFDYAATYGNIKLLKYLRKKGIEANNISLINAANGTRKITNKLDVYKYLIDEIKINPAVTNRNGSTVLHIIAMKPNHSDIIKYFINKGLDVNHVDNEGNNALILASSGNDLENIKTILPRIKNINAVNANGESALTQAVKKSNPEIVNYLLENGADASVVDIKGNNLVFHLMHSYKTNSTRDVFIEKLIMLRKKGLNIEANQKDGSTLFHIAVAKNNIDLLKKISILDINVNTINDQGMTALHKASLIVKSDEILKYLLSIGADKNIKTEFGETAYDLASENDFLKRNNISIDFLK